METHADLDTIKRDIGLYMARIGGLTERGGSLWGCCPFHDDSNPSFKVDNRGGALLWYCFPCVKGGSIIDLEKQLAHCTEGEAICHLREELGSPRKAALARPLPERPLESFAGTEEYVSRYEKNLAEQLLDPFSAASIFLYDSGLYDIAERLRFGYARERFFCCPQRCEKCGNYQALVIPLFWDSTLVGLKFRALDAPDSEHKWIQAPGSRADFLWCADLPPVDGASKVVGTFEGVRDTALARALGFNAVGPLATSCVPEHNPSERFLDSVARVKTYAHAALIGDNDEAGKAAMQRLHDYLGLGAVYVHGLGPECKDLSEFYEKNGEEAAKEWLRKAYESVAECSSFQKVDKAATATGAPVSELVIQTLINVTAQPVRWTWPNRIPRGKLTGISGNPDTGKTCVALDLMARYTTGRDWPDAPNENEPGDVLLLSAEDDPADTLRPRLEVAGADLERVHLVDGVRVSRNAKAEVKVLALEEDLSKIEQALNDNPQIGIVVIDPVTSYLSRADLNKEVEMRRVLTPLRVLAERAGVAVLIISHFNKRGDVGALHRVGGAVAMTGVARAVWVFAKDPEADGEYLMLPVKKNVGKKVAGLRYRINEKQTAVGGQPVIEWLGEARDSDPDSVLEVAGDPIQKRQARAGRFLDDYLTEPKPSAEIMEAGKEAGISRSALFEAKKARGIRAEKKDGRWIWLPPGSLSEEAGVANDDEEGDGLPF